MSGTEHFTGEYYFNGKPIYAKTIYIASLPNATNKTYNHNISDVDAIWFDKSKCFAAWHSGGWSAVSFPYFAGSTTSYVDCYCVNTTRFFIDTGKYNRTDMQAYITLNYTKTTDNANENIITATPAN